MAHPNLAGKLAFAVALLACAASGQTAAAGEPMDGNNVACSNFEIRTSELFGDLQIYDVSDEGWVWVKKKFTDQDKYREVSGLVVESHVATVDYPTTHDTHDHNTLVLVDPDLDVEDPLLRNILSKGNEPYPEDENVLPTLPSDPKILEVEWETGIDPSEKSGDGAAPMFRKQAWPSVGDRFWAEGHWVFDCGHTRAFYDSPDPSASTFPNVVAKYYPSEIHPPRAAAAMRQVMHPLTSTGATPVPVTLTDLYIHGRGGYLVEQLECDMGIVWAGDRCDTRTTPINDNFTFNVCLPPKPAPQAILTWLVLPGVGNTRSEVLDVTAVPVGGFTGCANNGDQPLDTQTMLQVTAPLAGSTAQPEDVYARQLIAGWVFPSDSDNDTDPPLHHLTLRLDSMDLHDDQDGLPTSDGELSFFWLNVDAHREPWQRMSDFDKATTDGTCSPSDTCFCNTNTMDDYDDDDSCGNGELNFSGPIYDFYLRHGDSFAVRALGYEQDCYDSQFGKHGPGAFLGSFITCHGGDPTEIDEWGPNDSMSRLHYIFSPHDDPPYGVGNRELNSNGGNYELRVEIVDLPLTREDSANLSVEMQCTWQGEVLLVGKPLTCAITGKNDFGPGLPRRAVLDFSSTPTTSIVNPASFTLRIPHNVGVNNDTADAPCEAPVNASVSCNVGTVPGDGTATVPVQVVPTAPGRLGNQVQISATSSDSDPSNNSVQVNVDAYRPVTLIIRPKEGGIKNIMTSGVFPVAILTTPDFDASQVDVMTLCFGDAEAPAQRDCTEAHARKHIQDVDRDRDLDVLLHYEAMQTGIDKGDATACVIGRLLDGTGIYGCSALPPSR